MSFYRYASPTTWALADAPLPDSSYTVSSQGTPGNDIIEGFSNNITLAGGGGHDLYKKWGLAITVQENAEPGIDTIRTGNIGVNLELYPNVENVQFWNTQDQVGYAAGNSGNNVLHATGRAEVWGGGGSDVMIGGAGPQVFIVYKGYGSDVVYGFTPGEDDIRLKAGVTSFTQLQSRMTDRTGLPADASGDAKGVEIDLLDGEKLMIRDVTKAQLTANDFQLQLDTSRFSATPSFSDDFTGPISLYDRQSNPTGVWKPDTGFQHPGEVGNYTIVSHPELQIYVSPYYESSPGESFPLDPFTVSNGVLTITAQHRPGMSDRLFGREYTSGWITTNPEVEAESTEFRANGFFQTFGYFEIRAEAQQGAFEDVQNGLWPAFWLRGVASWPPEIDIMEMFGYPQMPASTKWWGAEADPHKEGEAHFLPNPAGMHTYGVLWDADWLTWYFDGVEVYRKPTEPGMNQDMYILANLALGDQGGPLPAGFTSGNFKIDYIKAYPLSGAPPSGQGGAFQGNDTAGQVWVGTQYADTITGGHQNDTVSGGAGADLFIFNDEPWNHGRITDFSAEDTLDLKGLFGPGNQTTYTGGDPYALDYLDVIQEGSDVRVTFDWDGAATGNQWPSTISLLLNASVATVQARIVYAGGGSGQTFNGNDTQQQTWTGTSGADTINIGRIGDTITSGGGDDRIYFSQLPWNSSTLTDFDSQRDRLDLVQIFDNHASWYGGSDPVADGLVIFESNGAGGTNVKFDRDGPNTGDWPFHLATLNSVAPSSLVMNQNWVF